MNRAQKEPNYTQPCSEVSSEDARIYFQVLRENLWNIECKLNQEIHLSESHKRELQTAQSILQEKLNLLRKAFENFDDFVSQNDHEATRLTAEIDRERRRERDYENEMRRLSDELTKLLYERNSGREAKMPDSWEGSHVESIDHSKSSVSSDLLRSCLFLSDLQKKFITQENAQFADLERMKVELTRHGFNDQYCSVDSTDTRVVAKESGIIGDGVVGSYISLCQCFDETSLELHQLKHGVVALDKLVTKQQESVVHSKSEQQQTLLQADDINEFNTQLSHIVNWAADVASVRRKLQLTNGNCSRRMSESGLLKYHITTEHRRSIANIQLKH